MSTNEQFDQSLSTASCFSGHGVNECFSHHAGRNIGRYDDVITTPLFGYLSFSMAQTLFKKYRTEAEHVFVCKRAEEGQQDMGAASAVAGIDHTAAGAGPEGTLPKPLVSSCPIFHGRDSFLETARVRDGH